MLAGDTYIISCGPGNWPAHYYTIIVITSTSTLYVYDAAGCNVHLGMPKRLLGRRERERGRDRERHERERKKERGRDMREKGIEREREVER